MRLSIHACLSARVLGDWPGWFAPNAGFDLSVGAAAALVIGLYVKQTLVTARRLDLMERPRKP